MNIKLMIARGSWKYIVPFFLIGIVLLWFIWELSILFFVFGIYLILFFRDPHREIQIDERIIYSAADGKVIEIDSSDNEVKIAIRMSPFDVHLNRSPITGSVKKIQYKPGKHHSVYFGGAEEKNEQNLILLENKDISVDVLQITGSFARRIECWVNPKDKVKQGERIGMIRFGSQTNHLVKLKAKNITFKTLVNQGDNVRAGLTKLIRLESTK